MTESAKANFEPHCYDAETIFLKWNINTSTLPQYDAIQYLWAVVDEPTYSRSQRDVIFPTRLFDPVEQFKATWPMYMDVKTADKIWNFRLAVHTIGHFGNRKY